LQKGKFALKKECEDWGRWKETPDKISMISGGKKERFVCRPEKKASMFKKKKKKKAAFPLGGKKLQNLPSHWWMNKALFGGGKKARRRGVIGQRNGQKPSKYLSKRRLS